MRKLGTTEIRMRQRELKWKKERSNAARGRVCMQPKETWTGLLDKSRKERAPKEEKKKLEKKEKKGCVRQHANVTYLLGRKKMLSRARLPCQCERVTGLLYYAVGG
jgi:hypothetical protein